MRDDALHHRSSRPGPSTSVPYPSFWETLTTSSLVRQHGGKAVPVTMLCYAVRYRVSRLTWHVDNHHLSVAASPAHAEFTVPPVVAELLVRQTLTTWSKECARPIVNHELVNHVFINYLPLGSASLSPSMFSHMPRCRRWESWKILALSHRGMLAMGRKTEAPLGAGKGRRLRDLAYEVRPPEPKSRTAPLRSPPIDIVYFWPRHNIQHAGLVKKQMANDLFGQLHPPRASGIVRCKGTSAAAGTILCSPARAEPKLPLCKRKLAVSEPHDPFSCPWPLVQYLWDEWNMSRADAINRDYALIKRIRVAQFQIQRTFAWDFDKVGSDTGGPLDAPDLIHRKQIYTTL
ncbi:hypothetical protein ACRALDRAFT_1091308 [Sodiomyces alcalophilus JCM 7366]|uniref:uncharacterized protein n=1 Tax=Sodiomyces alcalophilus JCM 7366 TaxID=591952 RepID=UPI0039B6D747